MIATIVSIFQIIATKVFFVTTDEFVGMGDETV